MPEIEITEDQRDYVEDLRRELAAHHVGTYGTVRPQDAIQFLIDHREEGVGVSDGRADADDSGAGAEGEGDATRDPEPMDDGSDAENGASSGEESGSSGGGRLNAMMQLLEEHDDKWEENESDEGKYAVTLPGGGTEQVRTKDDVRALLFKHYR